MSGSPRMASAALRQCQQALRAGEWAAAWEAGDAAVKQAVDWAWPWLYRGLSGHALRRRDALRDMEQAAELAPASPAPLSFLAAAELDTSEHAAAAERLQHARTRWPDHMLARHLEGLLALERDRLEEGRRLLARDWVHSPSHFQARLLRWALRVRPEPQVALPAPSVAPAADPAVKQKLVREAQCLARRGDWGGADSRLAVALAASPDDVDLRLMAAEYALRIGDDTRCQAILSGFLEEPGPEVEPALRAYQGALAARAGRSDEALTFLEGAPHREPMVHFYRGLACVAAGRDADVLLHFSRIVDVDPEPLRTRIVAALQS
jgi:tetratricopeptide (TPR) repeat protein